MCNFLVFIGIHSVQFDDNSQHIVAMKSLDGEVVPLLKKVKIMPEVEVCVYVQLVGFHGNPQRKVLQKLSAYCCDHFCSGKILCLCYQDVTCGYTFRNMPSYLCQCKRNLR